MFFSKNKQTATAKLKELSKTEKFFRGKKPHLSKIQIKHVDKWKTWEEK